MTEEQIGVWSTVNVQSPLGSANDGGSAHEHAYSQNVS
jgi:hypothetical protein